MGSGHRCQRRHWPLIAIELAKRGFNVIVVARTKSKLDVVAAEIESYGRQALAVPFDFSFATSDSYADLYSHLPMEDISVVVNNVGMAFGDAHVVGDAADTIEEHSRVINVNCEPMVRLSYEFASRLKAKRCGAIVNLSSLSAVVGVVPYLATYAGTKAFNKVFSDSLRAELQEFGVDVLTVTPGFVATSMVQGNSAHRPRTNFSIVNVDHMAKDTVDAIGRRNSTAGHRNHILAQWLYEKLPHPSWEMRRCRFMKTGREAKGTGGEGGAQEAINQHSFIARFPFSIFLFCRERGQRLKQIVRIVVTKEKTKQKRFPLRRRMFCGLTPFLFTPQRYLKYTLQKSVDCRNTGTSPLGTKKICLHISTTSFKQSNGSGGGQLQQSRRSSIFCESLHAAILRGYCDSRGC